MFQEEALLIRDRKRVVERMAANSTKRQIDQLKVIVYL